jgi:hypothetical protein
MSSPTGQAGPPTRHDCDAPTSRTSPRSLKSTSRSPQDPATRFLTDAGWRRHPPGGPGRAALSQCRLRGLVRRPRTPAVNDPPPASASPAGSHRITVHRQHRLAGVAGERLLVQIRSGDGVETKTRGQS